MDHVGQCRADVVGVGGAGTGGRMRESQSSRVPRWTIRASQPVAMITRAFWVSGTLMIVRFVHVALVLLLTAPIMVSTPGVAHSGVDTVVSIAGTVTGPTGEVRLGVNARGTSDELTGTGGSAHATFASPATFTFDGTLDNTAVTLEGTVTHAAFEFLVGTPVTLTADASTNVIHLTFGPIPAGPEEGETLTFTGSGVVTVAGSA